MSEKLARIQVYKNGDVWLFVGDYLLHTFENESPEGNLANAKSAMNILNNSRDQWRDRLLKEAIAPWLTLCAWGGTPELIHEFIKGQQDRIYVAQNVDADQDKEIQLIGKLYAGIEAVTELIRESRGISGLHLNGDVAPWDELTTGGRFEEWLIKLDDAVKAYDNWKAIRSKEAK